MKDYTTDQEPALAGNLVLLHQLTEMTGMVSFEPTDATERLKDHQLLGDLTYLTDLAPYSNSINLGSESAMRLALLSQGKMTAPAGEQYHLYRDSCDAYLMVADNLAGMIHEIVDGNPDEGISFVPAVCSGMVTVPSIVEYTDTHGSDQVDALLEEYDIHLVMPSAQLRPVERLVLGILRLKKYSDASDRDMLLDGFYEGCCDLIDTMVAELVDKLVKNVHKLLVDQCTANLTDNEVMTKMFNLSAFGQLVDKYVYDQDVCSVNAMYNTLMDIRKEWLMDRVVIDPLTLITPEPTESAVDTKLKDDLSK